MSTIGTIAWKELRAYFTSWIAYVICAGWTFLAAIMFDVTFRQAREMGGQNFTLAPMFGTLVVIFLFVTPLITMRLLADEKNTSTLELLFTSPVTEWQVVLGKWLGSLCFATILVALTGHFTAFSLKFGSMDIGPIAGYYVASLCLAATFCAFGLFCSSLTESQVVAGFLTFGGLLISWMLSSFVSTGTETGAVQILGELSILTHFRNMLGGTINTKDLVFFVSISFFFLLATVRVLESRKWR